jgi:hypothetical protein
LQTTAVVVEAEVLKTHHMLEEEQAGEAMVDTTLHLAQQMLRLILAQVVVVLVVQQPLAEMVAMVVQVTHELLTGVNYGTTLRIS